MTDKIKFVLGVIFAVFVVYVFMTIMWGSLMVPSIDIAYNATDNTTMHYSKAGIGFMKIALYFVPGVLGLGAIVWKLRQQEK